MISSNARNLKVASHLTGGDHSMGKFDVKSSMSDGVSSGNRLRS